MKKEILDLSVFIILILSWAYLIYYTIRFLSGKKVFKVKLIIAIVLFVSAITFLIAVPPKFFRNSCDFGCHEIIEIPCIKGEDANC